MYEILDKERESVPNAEIKPRLGTFDLTMIVVGLVIGMGIFSTPHEVAVSAQIPLIYFLAWITGGVVSFLGALTFAEIGSRYPAAGGFYKIFSHCYHPAFAFMVNWITVISNAASTAVVAIFGAEYIYPLIMPGWEHDMAVRTITTVAIVVLYGINFLGIKVSAKFLNVLMLIKISLLALLISAIFIPHGTSAAATAPAPDPQSMIKAFLLCFSSVFFTYGGYQQTMNFGSDVASPSRTLPRAIFMGMGLVLLLYLAVNYSYVHVLGFSKLQASSTPAADVAGMIVGNAAYYFIAVVMFLSVMAYVNVSVLSNPRIYYAMAEDGALPPILKRVNPRTQVQEYALTLFCIFILITIFFIANPKKILDYVMFFDSISLATAAAAIFILRKRAKKDPGNKEIFKMKGYPFIPVIYILVYICVNTAVLLSNPLASKIGFILFISGLPLFYLMRFLIKATSSRK